MCLLVVVVVVVAAAVPAAAVPAAAAAAAAASSSRGGSRRTFTTEEWAGLPGKQDCLAAKRAVNAGKDNTFADLYTGFEVSQD